MFDNDKDFDSNAPSLLIACMFPMIIITVILAIGYWISKKASKSTLSENQTN